MKFRLADLVLWCDDALVAVNKPAQVPTVPSAHDPGCDLLALLQPVLGRLWVVHRLDRDTSGVVVLARSAEAHRVLTSQFVSHTVTKRYHALVSGTPAWEERCIELRLMVDGDRRHRTVAGPIAGRSPSKRAVTDLRVLERFQGYTLLEAVPQTGRTHQIRAHLAAYNLPIVADPLYGDGSALLLSAIKRAYRGSREAERPLLTRLALHSARLEVQHPVSLKPVVFSAPYPKDLDTALCQLRKYAVQSRTLSPPTR